MFQQSEEITLSQQTPYQNVDPATQTFIISAEQKQLLDQLDGVRSNQAPPSLSQYAADQGPAPAPVPQKRLRGNRPAPATIAVAKAPEMSRVAFYGIIGLAALASYNVGVHNGTDDVSSKAPVTASAEGNAPAPKP